jgi:hypothetical protein
MEANPNLLHASGQSLSDSQPTTSVMTRPVAKCGEESDGLAFICRRRWAWTLRRCRECPCNP